MSDQPNAVEDTSDSPLRHARRNVLADDVYDILRDGLLSRRIEPGSRLNLDQLARELYVSNTPVRQALARLESEGLVTKEPYRGFAASRLLDSRTITELYEYRLLVEPPTAARAARRRTEEGASELEALCDVKTITQLLKIDPTDSGLPQRDIDFHIGMARQARNSVVVDNVCQTLTRMATYSGYGQSGAASEAWEEHRAIVTAIRAKEPEAAAKAMRVHLTHGLTRIRDQFG